MGDQWAIRTEGLTRRFGARTAVDRLSLQIPPGTIFGFLGPNGAGKTTTVRLLLGLLRPDAGWAEVLGQRVTSRAHEFHRRIGVVLDRDGLYDRLSACDNLQYHADIHHLSPAQARMRIESLLRFCELWERRDEPIVGWSRGMRQKLALARALVGNPPLLLLDEPTAGLDPTSLKMVRELIVSLAASKEHTIFLCTHHLDEAERICDQVGIIRNGRLLLQEELQALRARRSRPQVVIVANRLSPEAVEAVRRLPHVQDLQLDTTQLTVSLTDLEATEGVVAELVRQGAGIREVRPHTKSLEDIYLELVREDSADHA